MSRMCHAGAQELGNSLSHKGNDASRSVSRILSPPREAGDGHPSGMPVARHLVRSDPGRETSSPWTPRRPSLFDLAPGGVYRAGRSPGRRWALTPPFHRRRDRGRGCVFSVALSFGSPRLGVTQRPALWSPDFPQAANRPRPSDRLARRVYPWPRRFHAGRHHRLGPVCRPLHAESSVRLARWGRPCRVGWRTYIRSD